ncbi:MAG: hypothetical protein CMA86_04730 [Euryarchaeota archaeon]|nr:hypothetical protein [Euryarchaeota archaeon]|tara:strand:- start:141 stop:320 length:180 start_codon:yes stop_codon:yes gene_type:complete
MNSDVLAEELLTVVGEGVGKVVDEHVQRRPWVGVVLKLLYYGVPLGFALFLLNGVYGWM